MSSTATATDHYEQSELNYTIINGVVVIISLFVIATLLILPPVFTWYADRQSKLIQKQLPSRELYEYRLKEKELLNRLTWKSKVAQTVYIPIDMAMESVVDDYNRY